jgi:predicted Zn-dependent protease
LENVSSESVESLDGSVASSKSNLNADFAIAAALIDQGKTQQAIELLAQLIDQYPEQTVLYSNLASLQAGNGKLDAARLTLLRGIKSDPKFAQLFAGLQKVQGALAANAYNIALASDEDPIAAVDLPLFATLKGSINETQQTIPEDQQKALLTEQYSETPDELLEVKQPDATTKQTPQTELERAAASSSPTSNLITPGLVDQVIDTPLTN